MPPRSASGNGATAELGRTVPTTAEHGRQPAAPSTAQARDMNNAELLAALIGTKSAAILASIANAADLRQLAAVHPADLRDAGLSAGTRYRLEVLFELARRFGEAEWKTGDVLGSSAEVWAHYRERLACEAVEVFLAVLLDNKHRKIRDVVVAQGSLTASIVHPRDVYAKVIRESAAAVIFVHNHPSGDPTPSREDIDITRRLRDVGELIGIRVLDHVIIGKGRYVSFVDDGFW